MRFSISAIHRQRSRALAYLSASYVSAVLGGAIFTGTSALAAEPSNDVETVVIHASEQKLEKLKEVPKSISAVTGDELEKLETNDFRDILTRVGNVGMSYQNPQAGSLYIRGIGWASGVGPLDPSVGVTVDGVSYGINSIATAVNFVDIESFDVTRGPQGTLGGKNTSAGQITITTRKPTFTPTAEASIGYGELNTLSTKASVGGPIVDGLLAWRGTFYREQADGPWENVNDRNFSYKNTDRSYGRTQFLLTPGANFSALISVDFSPISREISDNYVYFNRRTPTFYDTLDDKGNPIKVPLANQPDGKLIRRWFTQQTRYSYEGNFLKDEINRLSQQTNNYGTKGASANLTWILGSHTLTSVTAYKDFEFDSGGGPISVFDIDRSPSTGHVEYHQTSQELRLNSAVGGFVDYQAGLYYIATRQPNRLTTARYGSDAGAYYANGTQYTNLDADVAGRGLMSNSLNQLFTKTRDVIDNDSAAVYGSINWHLSDPLTVTTGLRFTKDIRETSSERGIVDPGYAPELNPVSVNNVVLGGFASDPKGVLAAGNTADQLALANSVALKYFGIASYDTLSAAQKQQIADAKAIRLARLGSLYQSTDAKPFKEVLPTINLSASYKLSPEYTTYASWQHGEKAGISQIIGATKNGGNSAPVKAEKNDAYEIGIKSALLDHTLALSVGVYLQDIQGYLQPLYFYDDAQTKANNDGSLAYTLGLGSVPKVQSKGLELDASYSGFRYTTLRFAGAYNDAKYKEFETLSKPLELGGSNTPYYDASGKRLPGAAKFTANLYAEHLRPVFGNKEFHTNVNYQYTSSYNADPSLSRFTIVDAHGITDIGIGIGRKDKLFDVNVIVKNLFDIDSGFLGTWNTYFPSTPRWAGVTFSSKFY